MKKECWGHRVRRVWDGKVQGWPGPWGLAAGRAQHLQGHENNLSPLADAAPGRSRCVLGLAMYSVTSYRSAACCSKSGRCGLWPMAVCLSVNVLCGEWLLTWSLHYKCMYMSRGPIDIP